MATKAHKGHGFRCWLRWPRWRSRYDPATHQRVFICTKCGYTKAGLGEGVGNLSGGLGPGGGWELEVAVRGRWPLMLAATRAIPHLHNPAPGLFLGLEFRGINMTYRMRGRYMFLFVKRVLLLCVVLALVALPTPAQATHEVDNMVPTQNYNLVCHATTLNNARVCQTDNANLYWYADKADPGELEADDFAAVQNMLSTQFAPTDLAIYYDSTPVWSGSAETDLVYQEAEAALPLPAGFQGLTWCNGDVETELFKCDQTYSRIMSPDGYRQHGGSYACHETGHAVGLLHGNNAYPALDPGDLRLGCMVTEDQYPYYLGSDNAHLVDLTY